VSYQQPIVDKVKTKLAALKASLLSIAGRVQLIKSVIFSLVTYFMELYSWPISLLKTIEKWIRNFLWSGEINKRKLVTVSWKKVYKPYKKGGLRIRSLICLNGSFNLKLCWDILHSQQDWANFLKQRVIRKNKSIRHHIYSSIWTNIKSEYDTVKENSFWLTVNGSHVQLWEDNWCGEPILDYFNLNHNDISNFLVFVKDYIRNSQWSILDDILIQYPDLRLLANQVTIPTEDCDDMLIWRHNSNGELS